MIKSITIVFVLFIILLFTSISFAQDTKQTHQQMRDEELTKAAQNPIANMMSFPFQNNTNFKIGPDSNRTQNVLNIQPVLPFFKGRLITRTIFPLVWQPDYTRASGVIRTRRYYFHCILCIRIKRNYLGCWSCCPIPYRRN